MNAAVDVIGRAFVILCLTLTGVAAYAQDVGDVVSRHLARFSAGIVCTPPTTERRDAPDTVAGFTNVSLVFPPFTTSGRRVPAIIGLSFGVRVQAKSVDFDDVRIVVTHPPMGEIGATEQSWPSRIRSDGETSTYFSLEFDYELVEGPWTIEAWSDGEVLYRAGFDVVPARDVPEVVTECGFENLIS